ncbi:MAG: hypothetical protein A3G18_02975 [Rhodospirillales bacterium RIFCSPLOWO2_12_FULL_58_28]|nr:MAG: hypothetical protein A3H92_13505 [Rhodospirillales bacterium RIFCSPLOWO2_02_FULL_58_16]OHC77160.1 MAG: hypothetical protein A3G18_02975 [Rhodospirillales bacterium RIFCSPLOWO2_12_FULL_58_28]
MIQRVSLFFLMTLLLTGGASAATDSAYGDSSGAAPQRYVHPEKNYTIFIPSGAQSKETGEKIDLSIQSPKGYAVTLQTGNANHETLLKNMAAKLEALYLGKGNRWSKKIGERLIKLSGLDAYDALYEGGNSQTRVIIMRGRLTDFVFMFFASPRDFSTLEKDFDWILDNFHPAANEMDDASQPLTSAAPPVKTASAELQRFSEAGFGFSIDYPTDWVVVKPSPHVVMFSGAERTTAYYAVVSISNVQQSGVSDPRQAVSAALAGLKEQIAAGAENVNYLKEGLFQYNGNNLLIDGHEFVAEYTLNGQRYRKWALLAPRPVGGIVHIWSYTAPESDFATFHPVAETMKKSWIINIQ